MLIELLKKQIFTEVKTAVLRALRRNRDKDIKDPEVREDIADDVVMELGQLTQTMVESGKKLLSDANRVKPRRFPRK